MQPKGESTQVTSLQNLNPLSLSLSLYVYIYIYICGATILLDSKRNHLLYAGDLVLIMIYIYIYIYICGATILLDSKRNHIYMSLSKPNHLHITNDFS